MAWQQARRAMAVTRRQQRCGHTRDARYVRWEEPLQFFMRDLYANLPWKELARVSAADWNSGGEQFVSWFCSQCDHGNC
eukprot:7999591-Alexandrium_andersonii.AAC.1